MQILNVFLFFSIEFNNTVLTHLKNKVRTVQKQKITYYLCYFLPAELVKVFFFFDMLQ